jgi:hypothetical protein
MIGYVSGHVKARRKISMVQRGSCVAFAGIAWGLAGVRSRRRRETLLERVLLPVSGSLGSPGLSRLALSIYTASAFNQWQDV